MATSTGTKVALGVLGCGGVSVVGGMVCCAGGGVGGMLVLALAPEMLVSFFTEPAPLNVTVPPPDPVRAAETQRQLAAAMADPTQTAHVVPQDLLNDLWTDRKKVPVLSAQVDAQDRLVVDMSFELDPGQYLNLHARVPTMVLEHGWFKQLTCDELVVSGWDLGSAVATQDLSMNFNQQLAQQRRTNKDLDTKLNSLAGLKLVKGGFDVQFEPGTAPPLPSTTLDPSAAPTDPAAAPSNPSAAPTPPAPPPPVPPPDPAKAPVP